MITQKSKICPKENGNNMKQTEQITTFISEDRQK